MAEVGPAKSRRARAGDSYASQWNRFVAWSQASGRRCLPASPEDVAAYLEDRSETGARPSTLRVVAAAIARNHKDAGFDAPVHQGVARTVLDDLTQDDAPGASRALPLDLGCYLAIRKTASEPRWGRGGRLERITSARRRGAMGIAMIGLMRDARLRVSEAAALTWGDIERVRGGGRSRACQGCGGRQLSRGERRHHETPVADPSRRGRRRTRPCHETEPDSDSDRRGGEAGGVG